MRHLGDGDSGLGESDHRQPSAQGHLLAYPADIGPPSTPTMNFRTSQTRANNAVLTLDSQGRIAVTSSADTDLVFDVSGYFQ
jgi:hypothetical protein